MAENRFKASGRNDADTLRRATNSALTDLVKQLNTELAAMRARLDALEEE